MTLERADQEYRAQGGQVEFQGVPVSLWHEWAHLITATETRSHGYQWSEVMRVLGFEEHAQFLNRLRGGERKTRIVRPRTDSA
jgi:hypothetical protein